MHNKSRQESEKLVLSKISHKTLNHFHTKKNLLKYSLQNSEVSSSHKLPAILLRVEFRYFTLTATSDELVVWLLLSSMWNWDRKKTAGRAIISYSQRILRWFESLACCTFAIIPLSVATGYRIAKSLVFQPLNMLRWELLKFCFRHHVFLISNERKRLYWYSIRERGRLRHVTVWSSQFERTQVRVFKREIPK